MPSVDRPRASCGELSGVRKHSADIELLRNCQHGSEIAVYSVVEGGRKFIRKTAATASGIADLQREAAGWAWYQARRYPHRETPICRQLVGDGYGRIDVDWIEGRQGDYRAGVLPNREIIHLAIEQYCSIWPAAQDALVPLHGDFSVDNLIMNAAGLHIIDWEHFQERGGPWGFDALYLLYETLWFSTGQRRLPNNRELAVLAKSLTQLYTTGRLPESFVLTPLQSIRAFIQDHKAVWGEQLRRFPDKLLVVKFSDAQVAEIDRLVHQAFNGLT